MMDSFTYGAGRAEIIVPRRMSSQSSVSISTALVDAIITAGLSQYELAEIIRFRRVTKNAESFEKLTIKEASDRDLTGCTVYYFVSNWEDSEWVSAYNIRFVPSKNTEGYYEAKRIRGVNKEHYYNDLEYYGLEASDTVFVVKENTPSQSN